MHRLLNRLAILLLLAALVPAAHASGSLQAPPVLLDRIAAIVNNGVITQRQLDARTAQITAELQARGTPVPPPATLQRQVLNSMILNRIQLGIAGYNGITVSQQTLDNALNQLAQNNNLTVAQMRSRIVSEGHRWNAFTQQLRDHLIIQKLQQRTIDQSIHVTNQEVRDFLAQHAGQIDPGQQYHIAQILVPIAGAASPRDIETALNEAEKLRGELEHGANFAKLAVAHSAGQHALQGGDLGWLTADQMPTYFVRAVNIMKPGQISNPIRSPGGFHLVKLLGVRGGQKVNITQTHVRQILIKITPTTSSAQAEAKLQRLRRAIEQGASFATLAQTNSDDTASAGNGGDLGWVDPGQMSPQFQHVMDNTPVGTVSKPFRTADGWHIIEVLGRRKQDATDKAIRARARQIIFQRKQQDALDAWLRRIRSAAYVHILLDSHTATSASHTAG